MKDVRVDTRKQVREVGLQHRQQLPPDGIAHDVQPIHRVSRGQYSNALLLNEVCASRQQQQQKQQQQ